MVLMSSQSFAQDTCPCCDDFHQQFDFWVGDWIVLDTAGNQVGTNTISKKESNCFLEEHWKSSQGSTGTSMNYFDKSDTTWNQLWIDNSGYVLKLKGVFDAGSMILKSDLNKGQKGVFFYNQIRWTKNSDGTVTQLWESYEENGKLIQTLFKGIYKSKE